MKSLIIIRGNSGSGKTTLAKSLQKRFGRNTMLISQDVVRRDMLNVKDGADTAALPLLAELLRYGYAHSEVTILEGILRADWYRSLFELAVQLYGGHIFAYYYDLTFEETLKRHWTKPNANEFGEEELRSWWRDRDYLETIDEVRITCEQDAGDLAGRIDSLVHAGGSDAAPADGRGHG